MDIGNLQGLGRVTGHDHFGAFFSRPSDHEDRQPRLRAWEREGYAMWKMSSSTIPEDHLMCQMVMVFSLEACCLQGLPLWLLDSPQLGTLDHNMVVPWDFLDSHFRHSSSAFVQGHLKPRKPLVQGTYSISMNRRLPGITCSVQPSMIGSKVGRGDILVVG